MRLLEYSLILTICARIGIAKVSKIVCKTKIYMKENHAKKNKRERKMARTNTLLFSVACVRFCLQIAITFVMKMGAGMRFEIFVPVCHSTG